MAKKYADLPELPKLPYGQGSFNYYDNGTSIKIQYKRNVELPDGTKEYKSVTGDTVKECMKAMDNLRNNVVKKSKKDKNALLCDALNEWADTVKKGEHKPQSYTRLKSTIKNQIENSDIGHNRYASITTVELQELITYLNDVKNYSHSVIKKTFDCLNAFYRYKSVVDKFDNPMLLVVMPTRDNIIKEDKEIEFFEQSDIQKFVDECGVRNKYTTNQKYKYGYAIAANIYLGLRGGELLALQWKDIDFDRNTVYVCKTLIERENEAYDKDNPERMEELGIKKIEFVVQNSTKKNKNRYVPINSKAKELLLLHKSVAEFTDSDDYVISTRNRKTTTLKNLSDSIQAIERNAETTVQSANTHVLRHTCASLYFRRCVPIENICQILGNTREVCEKTYIHFIEEQLQKAAEKSVEVFEI